MCVCVRVCGCVGVWVCGCTLYIRPNCIHVCVYMFMSFSYELDFTVLSNTAIYMYNYCTYMYIFIYAGRVGTGETAGQ